MTVDKSNSIHLPGSGTIGIEQLSVLSNIRSPGIWLYRIDQETVSQCMHSELQPPYCDAPSPTLINSRRPTTTTIKSQTHTETTTPKPSVMFKSIDPNESQEQNLENSIEPKKLKNKVEQSSETESLVSYVYKLYLF